MTLNSNGLGIGASPGLTGGSRRALTVNAPTAQLSILELAVNSVTTGYLFSNATQTSLVSQGATFLSFETNSNERMRISSSGQVGIAITPTNAYSTSRALQIGQGGLIEGRTGDYTTFSLATNAYLSSAGNWTYSSNARANLYAQSNGAFTWASVAAGTGVATFTPAMTLDASGNLLVGVTSGTTHIIKKTLTPDAGNVVLDIYGNNTSATFYSVGSYAANAANAAAKFGRDATTLRSINAGGTVNASGADYAEYMVKCGDFVIAKGDVAGIDSNGKLTNVFADAVSFVVKSTDPSYVGNDKWGVDLEGAAIEAARQLVDRIAFAGQVPVNVTGAKAGDYIVPVVNGTGIKGISVSKPTFEQYQIAVGKVITIDTDGRARIIVKVA